MNNQVDLLTRAQHKPTILVTGGSGVIGSTLLPRLTGGALRPEVIALVHRRDIPRARRPVAAGQRRRPAVRSVGGRVRGAGPSGRRRRACRGDRLVQEVRGPCRHQCRWHTDRFCGSRSARRHPLVHVSTAYLHPQDNSAQPRTSVRYAASKRAAGTCGPRGRTVPASIVRPVDRHRATAGPVRPLSSKAFTTCCRPCAAGCCPCSRSAPTGPSI